MRLNVSTSEDRNSGDVERIPEIWMPTWKLKKKKEGRLVQKFLFVKSAIREVLDGLDGLDDV